MFYSVLLMEYQPLLDCSTPKASLFSGTPYSRFSSYSEKNFRVLCLQLLYLLLDKILWAAILTCGWKEKEESLLPVVIYREFAGYRHRLCSWCLFSSTWALTDKTGWNLSTPQEISNDHAATLFSEFTSASSNCGLTYCNLASATPICRY